MAANDTVQLTVQGVVKNQMHLHTLHFRLTDATYTDGGLIDAWQAGCRTAYRALFVTFDQPVQLLTARQVCGTQPLRAAAQEVEVTGSILGTRTLTGQGCAPWLASLVSVRTALAGKSRRGRFFLGGLLEDDLDGALLGTTYLNLLQTYLNALATTFIGTAASASGAILVIHSPKLAQPGVQCQDSSTPVTGLLKRDQLTTMKSRRAGSGL